MQIFFDAVWVVIGLSKLRVAMAYNYLKFLVWGVFLFVVFP